MAGEGMPVKRTSLVDQLVSTIQHELITGQYPAGTAFTEEDVKTRYNVSRSTTREALVRLEEDGFLSRDPGTRTLRFRTLTEEEIRDVYYARRFYEGSGINHAKHATEGQLKEISDSATSLCEMLNQGNAYDVVEAEWRCHTAIVACIGSSLVTDQYKGLLRKLSLALAQIEDPREDMVSGQEHVNIAQLLVAKDYRQAKKALFAHLDAGEKELLDCVRGQTG